MKPGVPVKDCLVCGSEEHARLFDVDQWTLRRCQRCKFVFLAALPDWSLKTEINQERYEHSTRLNSPARKRMQLRDDRECLDDIERVAKPGALLDIGCATGSLLALARERGWRVTGIELDTNLASEAAVALGASNVHTGTLAGVTLPPQSFDVIVMRSVLEHLPDPRVELDRVRKLLRPGGLLFLLVPNIESLESALYKSKWFALTPGDHLWFFSPATLDRFLSGNGYASVWLTTSESFRDTFVGFLFAVFFSVRDFVRRKRPSTAEPSREASSGRSTGFFGRRFSPMAIGMIEMFMEALRFLVYPLFWLYAKGLQRRGRGASVRGLFAAGQNFG